MARLKGELQADNGDVLYPHTSAEVVFMADGTKAEEKIKDIEQKVTNIDVSGDVRQVINERVNADTSKPLSTLISEWVNAAKIAILNSINGLPQKSIWTDARGAKLDNLDQRMTTTKTNINNNTNAARDNIKSHMTSLMGSPKVVKSVQRGTFEASSDHTITINSVNVSKSIVISETSHNGSTSNYTNAVVLENSTTLKFIGKSYSLSTVAWQVIEFY